MTGTGDSFPGTTEVMLHLGNDAFPCRVIDRNVTGDSAFVVVELGGGIKILTRYTDDLRRLSVQLLHAAEQLDQAHARGGIRDPDADDPYVWDGPATPEANPVLAGQSVLW